MSKRCNKRRVQIRKPKILRHKICGCLFRHALRIPIYTLLSQYYLTIKPKFFNIVNKRNKQNYQQQQQKITKLPCVIPHYQIFSIVIKCSPFFEFGILQQKDYMEISHIYDKLPRFTFTQLIELSKQQKLRKCRFSEKPSQLHHCQNIFSVSAPFYLPRNTIVHGKSDHTHKLRYNIHNPIVNQDYLKKGKLESYLIKKHQESKSKRNLLTNQKPKQAETKESLQKTNIKNETCEPMCGLFRIKCCNCCPQLDNFNVQFINYLKRRNDWGKSHIQRYQQDEYQKQESIKRKIITQLVLKYTQLLNMPTNLHPNLQKISNSNSNNSQKKSTTKLNKKRNQPKSKMYCNGLEQEHLKVLKNNQKIQSLMKDIQRIINHFDINENKKKLLIVWSMKINQKLFRQIVNKTKKEAAEQHQHQKVRRNLRAPDPNKAKNSLPQISNPTVSPQRTEKIIPTTPPKKIQEKHKKNSRWIRTIKQKFKNQQRVSLNKSNSHLKAQQDHSILQQSQYDPCQNRYGQLPYQHQYVNFDRNIQQFDGELLPINLNKNGDISQFSLGGQSNEKNQRTNDGNQDEVDQKIQINNFYKQKNLIHKKGQKILNYHQITQQYNPKSKSHFYKPINYSQTTSIDTRDQLQTITKDNEEVKRKRRIGLISQPIPNMNDPSLQFTDFRSFINRNKNIKNKIQRQLKNCGFDKLIINENQSALDYRRKIHFIEQITREPNQFNKNLKDYLEICEKNIGSKFDIETVLNFQSQICPALPQQTQQLEQNLYELLQKSIEKNHKLYFYNLHKNQYDEKSQDQFPQSHYDSELEPKNTHEFLLEDYPIIKSDISTNNLKLSKIKANKKFTNQLGQKDI